jgi:predicted HTH transcriptional regulator
VRLVELLKRHEGKTLEYKRDLSSPESILKCLVAFANTGGGIVVIGVEDGSKNVRGVPDVLAGRNSQTWSPTRSAHASFRISR